MCEAFYRVSNINTFGFKRSQARNTTNYEKNTDMRNVAAFLCENYSLISGPGYFSSAPDPSHQAVFSLGEAAKPSVLVLHQYSLPGHIFASTARTRSA